jgi:hypothetical protein
LHFFVVVGLRWIEAVSESAAAQTTLHDAETFDAHKSSRLSNAFFRTKKVVSQCNH